MSIFKKIKQKKQLELYFRCLSSVCVNSSYLSYYFTQYDFTWVRDRLIGKRFFKKVLRKWNIQDAPALRDNIKWLLEEGSRKEFKRTLHRVTPLSERTREQYMKAHADDKKLYIANYGLHILTEAGIAAFDYAWAIYLCRIGRELNLLSKKEADNYMLQAGRLSQKSYSNWFDYLIAFHIGSHFYAADIDFTNYDRYNFNYSLILSVHPKSPMRDIPWNNELIQD